MLKKGVSFLEKMNIDKEKLQAAKASTADYLGDLKAIIQEKPKQEEVSQEVFAQQKGNAQVQIGGDEKKTGLFTYQHGDKEIVVEKNDVLDAAELLVDVSSPRGAAKRLIKVMRD